MHLDLKEKYSKAVQDDANPRKHGLQCTYPIANRLRERGVPLVEQCHAKLLRFNAIVTQPQRSSRKNENRIQSYQTLSNEESSNSAYVAEVRNLLG